MTIDEKKALLERYKSEGGLKNLQWVNEYLETVTDTAEKKDVVESGWTPGQIFTLNGFSWEHTEEKKRNKMLEALLQECWDEYGMDKPDECTKKHAVPELSKYWYSKNKHVQEDTNKVDQSMNMRTNLGMATMHKAIGNASSSGVKQQQAAAATSSNQQQQQAASSKQQQAAAASSK